MLKYVLIPLCNYSNRENSLERAHPTQAAVGTSGVGGMLAVPRKKRSDLDDLSFDMNFDSETAQRIRAIAAAKERAVQQEDYDTAKVLVTDMFSQVHLSVYSVLKSACRLVCHLQRVV
jgi:hypothetical protein